MFANWYAELNLFSFATFPSVNDYGLDLGSGGGEWDSARLLGES